jgi:hypothetical protein
MEEMIYAYKILAEMSEMKRPPARRRLRREGNLKTDLKYFGKVVDWINQDMGRWRAVLNTERKLSASIKCRIY